MKRLTAIAGVIAASAWLTPREGRPASLEPATTLRIDGRTNANVSIAARDAFVVLVWSGAAGDGATDIYTAVSRDAGATFGAPVRVNDTLGDARVSGEQPPRVALLPRRGTDPAVVVVWTGQRDGAGRLLTAQSDDGGRTFSRTAIVDSADAPGNRGWESIAVDAAGQVEAMWLDHRDLAQAAIAQEHDHGASDRTTHDGVAMAQKSQLFFGSINGDLAPRSIARGVCYCCKTAMTAAAGKRLYLAWRHVYPGNVRDIAFTSSQDGGRTFAEPVRVSDDKWVLDGCPENGPAIAVAPDASVHIVWPTLVASSTSGEPTLGLFHAASVDGRRFEPRQRIATSGVPRHPQVAIDGHGTMIVVWDEQAGGSRTVAIGRGQLNRDASRQPVLDSIVRENPGQYPAVAAGGTGFVVAWSTGGSSSVIRVARIGQ